MKPKYFQFNCREVDALDLRQANAVLEYKPDIIIFEYPNGNKTPDMVFNKYSALEKPKDLVKKRLESYSARILKLHPWAKADTILWKNVVNLWKKNHQVMVYAIDAPSELTSEWLEVWRGTYPCAKRSWVWWVQIYLRERIMANNVQWILKNYKEKESPITLLFLQSFHWDHVKFLLKNPSKDEIWDYYFGQFSLINRNDIGPKIKELNKVFYKYWKKVSDF